MNKQNIRQRFTDCFIFIGILFLTFSCENEPLVTAQDVSNIENNTILKTLNVQDAIDEISIYIESNGNKKQANQLDLLNNVNQFIPVRKLKEKDGFMVYTFALKTNTTQSKKGSSQTYFDNVFVNIDTDGNIKMQLVRYIPDIQWLLTSGEIEYYSGEVQILSDAEEIMGSMILINGLDVSKEEEEEASGVTSKACRWVVAKTSLLCVGNLYGGGETCYFHHKYTLHCGSGPSGGTGNDTGGSDDEDPFGGGSGGSPIVGSPIIGSCEETDSCEEDIRAACLANGNSPEVCDCVVSGGSFEDCAFETELDHLISDMDKDCQKNKIMKFLNVDSEITNRITNNFFGNDEFNLQFVDIDISENLDAIGFTFPPAGMVLNESTAIIIGFDNSYLDNTTDLSMVMTTSHELIHTYLYYLFIKGELLSEYPAYTSMNIAFQNYESNPDPLNLEALGNSMHYVYNDFMDLIAQTIYTYALDNNISGITIDYCNKLVIGSHQNTESFENLTEEEQIEYSTIANNEENGHTDAKGSKCDE